MYKILYLTTEKLEGIDLLKEDFGKLDFELEIQTVLDKKICQKSRNFDFVLIDFEVENFDVLKCFIESGFIVMLLQGCECKNYNQAQLDDKKIKYIPSDFFWNCLNYNLNLLKIELENFKKIKDLELKNFDMENFIYSAFHDLKTPLFTLQGFLANFKEKYYEKLDEQGVKYLMSISNSAKRLAKMINDVFEFFRFEKVDYKFEKVNVLYNLRVALDEIQVLLEDDDIVINLVGFENKDVFVKAHNLFLTKVWVNLLTNAIKYRKDNEKLVINIGVNDVKPNFYEFFVEDNGIGIDSKLHNFIFELFTRIKEKDEEGTGVGLSIVKKIITKHNGKIWLESQKNIGTKFYFTLPKYEIEN